MINFNSEIFKNLCVVSAPSGAGKTSLIKKICSHEKISVSVSETSRKPRKGEVNGVDYTFIDKEDFMLRVQNQNYIEHALVHDNYYGTHLDSVTKQLKKDNIVILEIDYQGAEIVKKKFPLSRNIFVLPPSLEILEKRLRERGTDTEDVILKRLENAKIELSKASNYDYILINADFELAENKLLSYVLDIDMNIDEKKRKEPLIDKGF
ncbi:MAG: guanylate kinase [Gammaproteobacteria bacterium]|mgnify:FL=1|jgi:guanylate kinase|nr:guanylate kinase [Gammaproteobacteria bacterium]MBT6755035.1 guanylate kinase [Gammaproteobacteria bacterium]MBT7522994.1 guanylate kinase [Gammaproteobacteria bacterium]MBT7814467.1 guanylate kinase [Gammaproteobacteria bacterium]